MFVLARVIPGDPCVAAHGEKATPRSAPTSIIRYGLDKPVPIQFGIYLGVLNADADGVAMLFTEAGFPAFYLLPQFLGGGTGGLIHGDLDESLRFGRPVTDIIVERLPVTLELTFFALLFATVVGIPLGILSAIRRGSKTDVGTMVTANLGVSIPVFVLGLFLQLVFAVWLKDTFFALPPSGRLSAGAS